jgi:hypothetical protein
VDRCGGAWGGTDQHATRISAAQILMALQPSIRCLRARLAQYTASLSGGSALLRIPALSSPPGHPAILVPDNSVSLLFGALDSDGDTFTVTLASALSAEDIADEALIMDLSLGIGFGFQSDPPTDIIQSSEVVSGRLS